MADNASTPKKRESVSKTVQEIGINGQEPTERYCYKDGVGIGSDNCSLPLIEIPVIDFGLIASPYSSREELERFHFALSSCGCFMSINHGISSSFLDKVRSVTKQFFALPMEEKQKYARQVDNIYGYGNDTVLSEDQILDWNYRLAFVLSPEDQRQLKFWPENPGNFRETLLEYTKKLQLITEIVLKAMAVSLNLEDHCFLDQCGVQATLRARFNLYPPCSRHHQVLGLKPHADSSAITILLQDKEVEGLQILKDDQWFRVPIIPEALFINLGEQAEIMSNGLFKSPIHRVVINPERERCSLAAFYLPDPENDIEPIDGLVDETRPKRYKKVKNYFDTYVHYYQQGKRLIDALKI